MTLNIQSFSTPNLISYDLQSNVGRHLPATAARVVLLPAVEAAVTAHIVRPGAAWNVGVPTAFIAHSVVKQLTIAAGL